MSGGKTVWLSLCRKLKYSSAGSRLPIIKLGLIFHFITTWGISWFNHTMRLDVTVAVCVVF